MHSKIFAVIFIFFAATFSFQTNLLQAKNLSDAWVGEPASNFRKLKSVSADKYMIVTADEAASKAGAEILKKGGSAVDAVIAAQLVLNVVEPQSSGIGGGGFLLYYDAKTKKTSYLNGRETAPEKAYAKMLLDKEGNPRQFEEVVQGGLSVATPGALKIMQEAHEKYGKLKWKELFEPAIKLARDGFIVSNRLHTLADHISYLKNFDEAAKIYLKSDGTAYQVGEVIKNPKLAKTLQTLAIEGITPFYSGKIANDIVHTVQHSKINPGILSLNDLKNYHSHQGDLICASYRIKYKICSMPLPSSGGVTLLQILGILENFDLAKLKPQSPEALHLIIEATRLAYADRNEYLADVSGVPLEKMLDKKYLKSRSALIKRNQALPKVAAGKFALARQNFIVNNKTVELPSTTHLSVVDEEGNAVSFTSSIEYFFGSALIVDGFLLNNQMTDFSFLPEINGKKVANAIEPNKQPRSSMTPVFVFDKNDKLLMVVGSPGGPRIIQYSLRTILDYLDWKIDIQKAISMPNFVVLNDVVELEKDTAIVKLEPGLKKLGHQVTVKELTSGIHAITIKNKKLTGGADPRRDGVASAL
ncbi:MAG: gamma-glutamyltransferase [Proteobacteria bacterium]|nr:gamma-glutamyltransferase [Pseudomonadota bacterium]